VRWKLCATPKDKFMLPVFFSGDEMIDEDISPADGVYVLSNDDLRYFDGGLDREYD